jgi:hypothetical protein
MHPADEPDTDWIKARETADPSSAPAGTDVAWFLGHAVHVAT